MERSERRRALGQFFQDRRGRLQPEDVGLPALGHRRVKGLRREEVAALAGVGVSWYTMLENGSATGVSEATLAAIARALRFTPDEIAYMRRLADERAGSETETAVDALTLGALRAITGAPAYVITSQWIVLAWNAMFARVWGIEAPGGAPFNIVTRMFCDPALRAMHGEAFPHFARGLVAMVRSSAAAALESETYRDMCAELQSDPLFAELWATYDLTTPTNAMRTSVISAAIGAFTYTSITLDITDGEHWLVMQIPDPTPS